MRFEKPNPSQRWDNPCFVVGVEGSGVEDIVGQVADHLFSVGMFVKASSHLFKTQNLCYFSLLLCVLTPIDAKITDNMIQRVSARDSLRHV